MKAGTLLLVLHDVIESLVKIGVLDADGNFSSSSVEQDIKIAVAVEEVLKAHGIEAPPEVDKVINALPLVMSLLR